jgi:hypothetical protein
MIRTAGGRAVDGIKPLAVLQTISGAGIVVVMHHTGWSSYISSLSSKDLSLSVQKVQTWSI